MPEAGWRSSFNIVDLSKQGTVTMKTALLLPLLLMLLSVPVSGQVYKWVDEQGNVHYGDTLPDGARPLDIGGDVNTVDNQRYDFLPEKKPAANSMEVVMYATSWCPYCRQARQYFKRRGIAYREYDIERNPDAKSRYDSLGGKGVPLILIGDRKMSGFSVERFERLYPG